MKKGSPVKQLIEHISPDQTVLELLSLSDNNPDTRNELMRDLAAYMVLPIGSYVRQHPQIEPRKIMLSWESNTTTLEVEQFNQEERHEYATEEIHERANEIARAARRDKVFIVVGENNADRDIIEVYEKEKVAKRNKRAIEEDYGIPVRIEPRPLRKE